MKWNQFNFPIEIQSSALEITIASLFMISGDLIHR